MNDPNTVSLRTRTARTVFWVGLGLFLASLIFAAAVWVRSAIPEEFDLPTLDGGVIRLSDTRSKTVILNFWASWCGPCIDEMPEVEAFYQAHKAQDILVIGINVGESPETARDFVSRVGVTFPIALDEDTDVATRYRMRGLPMTVVINRWGLIRWNHLGQVDREWLEAHLPW